MSIVKSDVEDIDGLLVAWFDLLGSFMMLAFLFPVRHTAARTLD